MKLDKGKYKASISIKPGRVLFALVILNLSLGLIAYIFPEEGVNLAGDFGLKFLSRSEVFTLEEKEQAVVDVDEVLSGIKPLDMNDSTSVDDSLEGDVNSRLNAQLSNSFTFDSTSGRWIITSKQQIEFPSDKPDVLDFFFNALALESNKEVIRILHYGDSQLEGDRITDYLRSRFQRLFGGRGPGIVLPLEPTAGMRRSASISQSVNFKKHAIYKKGSKPESNKYGIGGASFEIQGFTSNIIGYDTTYIPKLDEDSVAYIDTVINPQFESVPTTTAFLQIRNAKGSYANVRSFNRVKLLYAAAEPFKLELTIDTLNTENTVEPAPYFGVAEWATDVRQKLNFNFTEGQFPLLYGVALDGDKGVAVDNFPMRGSAALGFSTMNQNAYAKQLKDLNVRLIVLQYGVNVVPGVLSDYTYYKNMLTKELQSIKAAFPDVSILVIGPSDMSRNKGGSYVSYSNIPLIRDAMKEAAFNADCAFWDLYQAMGGENSMTAWVEKGYAGKDYTHFSFKGAKYVGEMLFESLMEQFQNKGFIN